MDEQKQPETIEEKIGSNDPVTETVSILSNLAYRLTAISDDPAALQQFSDQMTQQSENLRVACGVDEGTLEEYGEFLGLGEEAEPTSEQKQQPIDVTIKLSVLAMMSRERWEELREKVVSALLSEMSKDVLHEGEVFVIKTMTVEDGTKFDHYDFREQLGDDAEEDFGTFEGLYYGPG